MMRLFRWILSTAAILLLSSVALGSTRGAVIDDFDGPVPDLQSYPEQDLEPEEWIISPTPPDGATLCRFTFPVGK